MTGTIGRKWLCCWVLTLGCGLLCVAPLSAQKSAPQKQGPAEIPFEGDLESALRNRLAQIKALNEVLQKLKEDPNFKLDQLPFDKLPFRPDQLQGMNFD